MDSSWPQIFTFVFLLPLPNQHSHLTRQSCHPCWKRDYIWSSNLIFYINWKTLIIILRLSHSFPASSSPLLPWDLGIMSRKAFWKDKFVAWKVNYELHSKLRMHKCLVEKHSISKDKTTKYNSLALILFSCHMYVHQHPTNKTK